MLRTSRILSALTPQKEAEIAYELRHEDAAERERKGRLHIYLDVPRGAYQKAKDLGARWDASVGKQYIGHDDNYEALKHWIAQDQKPKPKPSKPLPTYNGPRGTHPQKSLNGEVGCVYEFYVVEHLKNVPYNRWKPLPTSRDLARNCTKQEAWRYAQDYLRKQPDAAITIYLSYQCTKPAEGEGAWDAIEFAVPMWTTDPAMKNQVRPIPQDVKEYMDAGN